MALLWPKSRAGFKEPESWKGLSTSPEHSLPLVWAVTTTPAAPLGTYKGPTTGLWGPRTSLQGKRKAERLPAGVSCRSPETRAPMLLRQELLF